jgi:hypothetical protein
MVVVGSSLQETALEIMGSERLISFEDFWAVWSQRGIVAPAAK